MKKKLLMISIRTALTAVAFMMIFSYNRLEANGGNYNSSALLCVAVAGTDCDGQIVMGAGAAAATNGPGTGNMGMACTEEVVTGQTCFYTYVKPPQE